MTGGHFKTKTFLNRSTLTQNRINGLCTPCHDPHGVTPTLDTTKRVYAVPMLKGTWLTSPYKEDAAIATSSILGFPVYGRTTYYAGGNPTAGTVRPYVYQTGTITEDESKFAGLCLRCHTQQNLKGGTATGWKGLDRVHKSVKGWGGTGHAYTCSKCHVPHVTGLPRLLITDCLDVQHRGRVASGGYAGYASGYGSSGSGAGKFPVGGGKGYSSTTLPSCHSTSNGNTNGYDNKWNSKTPWPLP
jgi:hypothetical protein